MQVFILGSNPTINYTGVLVSFLWLDRFEIFKRTGMIDDISFVKLQHQKLFGII